MHTPQHTLLARTTKYASIFALALGGCAAPTSAPTTTYENDLGETPSSDEELTSGTLEVPASASGEAARRTAISADAILAKLRECTKASSSPYARDVGGPANIDVCKLGRAVFWTSDMDIDCDGKSSAACNRSTDPSYQSATAGTDSRGAPLDAATLPFIVVPGVSSRWSYKAAGIKMGSVGMVIYDGKVEFGIVGDVGPTSIIGEASYAMASSLGINPNPRIGGVSSGVTYVIFTGSSSVVTTREDHAEAVTLGTSLAEDLLASE